MCICVSVCVWVCVVCVVLTFYMLEMPLMSHLFSFRVYFVSSYRM